ncbi:MAG: GNAT family N-acetyltransferase [Candidatus Heimdallarchaeota archaeon]|nr:MAG: GNAT family N-acetyltransferase [Candidatus Heimdallarchaeota archaeon]
MLEGKQVSLRGLELSDVDELMRHWNKKEVKRFLLAFTPHSIEEERDWIRNTWKRRKEGKSYVFGIILKSKNLYIGNVEVSIMNPISRRGLIGIAIFNTDYWSQGLGSEALELIIDYAFYTLNLHSVELDLYENNERAYSCYKKVGFVETGRRRQAYFSDGQHLDAIVMDILASEWKKKKK